MQKRILNLWTLGGLSVPDLIRRTARASWHDDVFGQGGRMAFYHFLAIFPSLLVFFSIASRIPHLGPHLKSALQEMSRQLLPDQVSQLFLRVTGGAGEPTFSGIQLLSVSAGAVWAAHNGTWAMIYGLNRAYEVEEHRSWRELSVTIAALTLCLAVTGSIALVLIFCSGYLQAHFHAGTIAVRVLEWLVLAAALSFSFAMLYRFAPNLRDHEWRWSTPGAVCALVLWIGSTLVARVYFGHVNDYARSYGYLNGAVMLLLWLYATNGAILIGGEMNSEIEKAATQRHSSPPRSAQPRPDHGSKR